MISSLTTPAAALALDWANEVKGHLRLDVDTEKTRVESLLIPAAADWCEAVTGRQLINATWTFWWPSFDAACQPGCGLGFPSDAIVLPRPPLGGVTHVKYYDTANAIQTWSASNYAVVAPAGPKASPGWLRPVAPATYPSTYERPDAVEIRLVAGYGASYASVPGGLKQAMLILLAELFERREEAVTGTIIQQVPVGALSLALGYLAPGAP